MVDPTVILAGAVPSALLALVDRRRADAARAGTEDGRGGARRRGADRAGRRRRRSSTGAASCDPVAQLAGPAPSASGRRTSPNRSCSARCWRRRSSRDVAAGRAPAEPRRHVHLRPRASDRGDIDVYVEYSGTAQTAIFHQPVDTDRDRVFDAVRAPLRGRRADAAAIRSGSRTPLPCWSAATMRDGWGCGRSPTLAAHAGGMARRLRLRVPPAPGRLSRPGARVRPAVRRAADARWICRSSTARWRSGRWISSPATRRAASIEAYGLTMLEDDRHYFPPVRCRAGRPERRAPGASGGARRARHAWPAGSPSPTCGG